MGKTDEHECRSKKRQRIEGTTRVLFKKSAMKWLQVDQKTVMLHCAPIEFKNLNQKYIEYY